MNISYKRIGLCAIGFIFLLGTISAHGANSVDSKRDSEPEAPPLPKGLSGWSYSYDKNVVTRIRDFNAREGAHAQFKYFFPYAGSLDFDKEKREVSVYYNAKKISDRYAKNLPVGTLIMPIIDARADHQEFHDWTDEQYKATALKTAQVIIEDRNAVGVQIDIEPFDKEHLPLYRYLREVLNAKGKYTTMFVGTKSDEVMTQIFESCDIVILSGYDLNGENTGVDKYGQLLSRAMTRVHRVAVQTKGRYMVGIPTAAAWGEYEYVVGPGGRDRVESGWKQEDYVRSALTVLEKYSETPEFLGLALWQLSRLRSEDHPEQATKPTKMPDYVRPSVWAILENESEWGQIRMGTVK